MKSTNNTPLVIAFAIVVVLFLLFGGGAMTGGMNGGMHGGMNGNGWMAERSWMWTPALIALCLGVVLGWVVFKKKE
jgi:hypothetical protein